jgi:hypothetical protein
MDKKQEKMVAGRDQKAEKTTFTPQERRILNRRKKSDRGYMYISTVGWIDRREIGRRSKDTYLF